MEKFQIFNNNLNFKSYLSYEHPFSILSYFKPATLIEIILVDSKLSLIFK